MTSEHVRVLTLLSDFGDRDTYVGVMKGVIAQINPLITVLDLLNSSNSTTKQSRSQVLHKMCTMCTTHSFVVLRVPYVSK